MSSDKRPIERRLSAILAADIAGYSALMGADEEATVLDLKGHQSVVLPMVGDFGGRVIDTAGDGILAEFPSVLNAVRCAVEIQQTMAERNTGVAPGRRMLFRIGVNLGDVVYDKERIYGDGVNVAARLEAIAPPGGICVSRAVREAIGNKLAVGFADLGEKQVKNIVEPVHVFEVSLAGVAVPHLGMEPVTPIASKASRSWTARHITVLGIGGTAILVTLLTWAHVAKRLPPQPTVSTTAAPNATVAKVAREALSSQAQKQYSPPSAPASLPAADASPPPSGSPAPGSAITASATPPPAARQGVPVPDTSDRAGAAGDTPEVGTQRARAPLSADAVETRSTDGAPPLTRPPVRGKFDGLWDVATMGGAACPIKSGMHALTIRNGTILESRPEAGEVWASGEFVYTRRGGADPKVIVEHRGWLDGDGGEARYRVRGGKCEGVSRLTRRRADVLPTVSAALEAPTTPAQSPPKPSSLGRFDGTWQVKLTGGEKCSVKSNTWVMAVSNGSVEPSRPKPGRVEPDGSFTFMFPAQVDPSAIILYSGKISADTGRGQYKGLHGCTGVVDLQRLP